MQRTLLVNAAARANAGQRGLARAAAVPPHLQTWRDRTIPLPT